MLWSRMLDFLVFHRVLQTCWLLQCDFLTWWTFYMLIRFLCSLFFGCFCSRKTSLKVPTQDLRGFKLLSGLCDDTHRPEMTERPVSIFSLFCLVFFSKFTQSLGCLFDLILCFFASKGTQTVPILPFNQMKIDRYKMTNGLWNWTGGNFSTDLTDDWCQEVFVRVQVSPGLSFRFL